MKRDLMYVPNLESYRAATTRAGVMRRDTRGLLAVTGDDRARWLNNLVTNVITTLQPGEGNYAFVINVKGRVQFDLNMLVRPDRILLDVDRRWIDAAARFLNRYIITEKVEIRDITETTCRAAVIGPRMHEAAAAWGVGNLAAMAWLQNVECHIAGTPALIVRNDFTGLPGVEVILFGESREAALDHVIEAARTSGAADIDIAVAETLRIEHGIPAGIDDIDEDVIPPETGQIERGISYRKGCYLGQEVIERMRSHKILARKLVGIRFPASADPAALTSTAPPTPIASPATTPDTLAPSDIQAQPLMPIPHHTEIPLYSEMQHHTEIPRHTEIRYHTAIPRQTPLVINGAVVGRTMSSCHSPALGAPLSLGYVKTAHATPGTRILARLNSTADPANAPMTAPENISPSHSANAPTSPTVTPAPVATNTAPVAANTSASVATNTAAPVAANGPAADSASSVATEIPCEIIELPVSAGKQRAAPG